MVIYTTNIGTDWWFLFDPATLNFWQRSYNSCGIGDQLFKYSLTENAGTSFLDVLWHAYVNDSLDGV